MTRRPDILTFGPPTPRDRGATAVEYALLVALIAAVIAATVALIGPALLPGFQTVVSGL